LRVVPRSARRREPWSLVAPVVVTMAALLIRAWRLELPSTYVFDEVYYVPDALALLDGQAGGPVAHPPLGKWLIAAGIEALGDNPQGWRIASLIFGSLAVPLTYILAHRLLDSLRWATLAAALVAADGLQIVQSRVATLDIFVSTLALSGVLLAHVYARRSEPARRSPSLGWLAGAGFMLGAALAVKWSALPVLAFMAVAVVARSVNRRREALGVIGLLGAVPLVVYVLSYARYWSDYGADIGRWLRVQDAMLAFHSGGLPPHPYASSSLGWLLLRRPVAYFFTEDGGRVRHIIALGNPVLWWAFLTTVPLLVRSWLRREDHAADVIVLGLAATYFPWLLVRRTSFLYYLTPLVPFMAVGVAWALQRLWRSSLPQALRYGGVVTYVVAAFVVAGLLLPVWLGLPIGRDHWERLMLFPGWR